MARYKAAAKRRASNDEDLEQSPLKRQNKASLHVPQQAKVYSTNRFTVKERARRAAFSDERAKQDRKANANHKAISRVKRTKQYLQADDDKQRELIEAMKKKRGMLLEANEASADEVNASRQQKIMQGPFEEMETKFEDLGLEDDVKNFLLQKTTSSKGATQRTWFAIILTWGPAVEGFVEKTVELNKLETEDEVIEFFKSIAAEVSLREPS